MPTACFPSLPPGYQHQMVWAFEDREGSYEFHRVYGPEQPLGHRAAKAASRLDEDRSYWLRSGDREPESRWISYADAHKLRSRLSFAHFSSIPDMRGDLPELLRARDLPEST
jgi:hypothetical protein